MFGHLPFCRVEQAGSAYAASLLNSKASVVYGGYNSLTDVLCARMPSIVIVRDMQDREQAVHASRLAEHTDKGLVFMKENEADTGKLLSALKRQLQGPDVRTGSIQLNGAEHAAKYIAGVIQ
jgi:predicted glycosyltransferase